MPEILVGENNVHFQDTIRPAARPIVFLHGAGGSHHSWRDQWAGLKGVCRLVIPDLPGHGKSAGPLPASIGEYSRWVAAFVAELRLDAFLLAGHSMGGAIALQAALDGIPGLRGLVLVGTGARMKVSPAISDGIGSRFQSYAPEMVAMMTSPRTAAELKDDVTADVLSTQPATFLSDFAACTAFDVMDRLGAIQAPALVIAGDADVLTPLKYGEYLARNLGGAVLKIVHDAGHLAMLEKPVEVNEAIRHFVQSLA